MKSSRILLSSLAIIVSVLPMIADAGPASQPSPRSQLVREIVLKWGNHVQEAYRADVRRWASDMGPVFAKASLEDLSRAARARSFDEMNNALLAARSPGNAANILSAALPGAPFDKSGKLLGDAATDLVFVPVTPCRIIDTRVAGGPIAANSTRDFDVTAVSNYAFQGGDSSNCNGVGAAGSFAAAVINFTVVTPSGAGYITAFPYLGTQPLSSSLNYGAGDIRGNLAIVKLDQGPSTSELNVYSFAQTHLVADIVGYFAAPDTTLKCVNTSVQSFTINANTTNFFNNPTCPAGYAAVTPYCWTASSGVYSQGSGYNANVAGNATFCSWQNTTGSNQTVFGGNVCCHI